MDNVIELNPKKRVEDKIKEVIRETIQDISGDEVDQKELETIIFNLYNQWYHNGPQLQVEYVEGTFVEVVRQIEEFYQTFVQNLLCALAAEKFAHYKTIKYAHTENNNNKDT